MQRAKNLTLKARKRMEFENKMERIFSMKLPN
jgi:hypothetical protein